MPTLIERFEAALRAHAGEFGVTLDRATTAGLVTYFELLMKWNTRLHLVAPCSPEEFATRHVLESLFMAAHIKQDASVIDVGSGGGLPAIPLVIARPDVKANLIESSQKKAIFLREVLRAVSRPAAVIANRFENVDPPPAEYIGCRALERLPRKLPTLIAWAPPNGTLLLFGGEALREELQKLGREFTGLRIPTSLRRYLLISPP